MGVQESLLDLVSPRPPQPDLDSVLVLREQQQPCNSQQEDPTKEHLHKRTFDAFIFKHDTALLCGCDERREGGAGTRERVRGGVRRGEGERGTGGGKG